MTWRGWTVVFTSTAAVVEFPVSSKARSTRSMTDEFAPSAMMLVGLGEGDKMAIVAGVEASESISSEGIVGEIAGAMEGLEEDVRESIGMVSRS